MSRSIVHRATFPAPHYLQSPTGAAQAPRASAAIAQAAKAQVQITETIVVIRKAVADVAGTSTLPGSDAELEDVVFEDDMLADARRDFERPRGHLTRRLLTSAREKRVAEIGNIIRIRLARRPFAVVQAKVTATLMPGRVVDLLVLVGPDTGRRVTAELGLAFPWDVLV